MENTYVCVYMRVYIYICMYVCMYIACIANQTAPLRAKTTCNPETGSLKPNLENSMRQLGHSYKHTFHLCNSKALNVRFKAETWDEVDFDFANRFTTKKVVRSNPRILHAGQSSARCFAGGGERGQAKATACAQLCAA